MTASSHSAAAPPAANKAAFNWRRLALNGGYSFIRAHRNAIGPFDVPPSGTLATEWGNGPADNPYRALPHLEDVSDGRCDGQDTEPPPGGGGSATRARACYCLS